MKKIITLIVCIICLQFGLKGQTTTIIHDTAMLSCLKETEVRFKNYRVGNPLNSPWINYNLPCFSGDTMYVVRFSNLTDLNTLGGQSAFPGFTVNFSNRNISNLHGLEYLNNLYFYAWYGGTINVSHNNITDSGLYYLPPNFGDQLNCALDISYNNITNITPLISKYLQRINASHNQMTQIPLLNLDGNTFKWGYVDFSYNSITSAAIINSNSGTTNHYPTYNLSHNLLTTFPKIVKRVTYNPFYFALDVSYNNISSIDSSIIIDTMTTSHYNDIITADINLADNNLGNLPSNAFLKLGNMHFYPSSLNLGSNNLSTCPELFFYCNYLSLSNNNIYCLPKLPQSINTLFIDTNKITCIPNAVATINGASGANYPVCNPTNNVNGCLGFPTVKGRIYLDRNKNGVKDGADIYLPHIKVLFDSTATSITDNNGWFSASTDSLGVKKVKIIAPRYHTAFPDSATIVFTRYDTTANIGEIGIQLTTIIDSLSINVTPGGAARPGFDYAYTITYKNVGTTTLAPNVTINYNNALLIYDSCNKANAINTGNSISFNISSLQPDEVGYAIVYFKIVTSAPIGSKLNVTSVLTANTVTALDSSVVIIRGSYDPNEKTAAPEFSTLQLVNGDAIDYIIHFQNTGNDTAFTVVLADTLNPKLKLNSFEMVGSSHNCTTTIRDNKIYFEFRNILLPDSNVNNLSSNGFVRYRVKPISTLLVGDTIPNKASIYFDYNKPVETNIARTLIVTPPLPVKLLSYALKLVQTDKKSVENTWITANEINASHFNIQRSIDGADFKTVGKVAAKGEGSYNFKDVLASINLPSTIFYRLQMVDKDGRIEYSSIKEINLKHQTLNSLSIYPNPAKGIVTIYCEGAKELMMIDYLGRTVYRSTVDSLPLTVNLKQLPKGIYVVKAIMNSREIKTEKLVVE